VTRTTETEARDTTRKGWVSEGEGWSEEADARGGDDMRASFFFQFRRIQNEVLELLCDGGYDFW
jgi:hypothetical protein